MDKRMSEILSVPFVDDTEIISDIMQDEMVKSAADEIKQSLEIMVENGVKKNEAIDYIREQISFSPVSKCYLLSDDGDLYISANALSEFSPQGILDEDYLENISNNIYSICTESLIDFELPGLYELEHTTSFIPWNQLIENGIISISEKGLIKCNDKEICGDLIVPGYDEKIKGLDRFAFKDCKKLASVALSEKFTEITEFAFFDCTSLEKVDFPEHTEEIGMFAFKGCQKLSSVNLKGLDQLDIIDGERIIITGKQTIRFGKAIMNSGRAVNRIRKMISIITARDILSISVTAGRIWISIYHN